MKIKTTLFFTASAFVLSACETTYSQNESAATATNAVMAESFAADGNGQWPPAGCKTPEELQALLTATPDYQPSYYMGLYSGDIDPLDNGNIFWLGSNHGASVQPPNSSLNVGVSPAGVGALLRWNITDTYIDPNSQQRAPETVAQHYYWDHDIAALSASTAGIYAYEALAVNLCEDGDLGSLDCEQPLFGEKAWRNDSKSKDFELCPPIILKSDPSSIYVWDQNDNDNIEIYEYSLAMILNLGGANASKSGMRIIIDPRVQNGGVGQR